MSNPLFPALVFSCVFAAVANAGDQSRPNVLLILSDDRSVQHVSCYDDENTSGSGW